jgi:signal transduction histidine kinase
LALKGYNEIVLIGASVFITVVGFVLLIAADNMQIRLTDKQIADAITSLEATVLEIRWLIGEMNSMKKRLSVYLEEGINQMVGDIPRPLFINKLNQVMWRTESKLAVCNSTNCLRRHIWYVKQE